MKSALAAILVFCSPALGQNSFINSTSHSGVTITCDLPDGQQFGNIGSQIDNAGMCVFTSIEMSARFAGLEDMRGWRDWCAGKYPGGGWPEKVDQCLADWFKFKGIKPIPYIQYQGKNPEKIMDLADKTGRMIGMTYGYSPRYGQPIQHMVCGIMCKTDYGVVLDNNFIGSNNLEWVKRQAFLQRSIYPNRSAWVFVWLNPGPPPSPKNKSKEV